MLVLSRKSTEAIRIGGNITVRVVEVRGGKVRIGIEAPTSIPVHREEVYERIHGETKGVQDVSVSFGPISGDNLPINHVDNPR